MKRILFLVIGILIFSSCFKEVDIDLPNQSEKLVLSCFFTDSQKVKVLLSKSQPANDTLFTIYDNISVSMITPNGEIMLTRNNAGYFESSFDGEQGVNYKINAASEKYGQITAIDSIPFSVPFQIYDAVLIAGVDEEGNNISTITIVFDDPAEDMNFYEIKLRNEYEREGFYVNEYPVIFSNDLAILNEGAVNETYGRNGLIFSDELIVGQKCYITISFLNSDISILNSEVEFRNVSDEYYKYKKRLWLHLENQYGDFWDGTGNPVEIYSNINGGYGIFAAYNETIHNITVQ